MDPGELDGCVSRGVLGSVGACLGVYRCCRLGQMGTFTDNSIGGMAEEGTCHVCVRKVLGVIERGGDIGRRERELT